MDKTDKAKVPTWNLEELKALEPEDGVFAVPRAWARRQAAKKRQKPAPSSDHPDWPRTVDEAVRQILSKISEEDKRVLMEMPREKLPLLHFTWGMGIRNDCGLWGGNEELLSDCNQGEMWADADSASWVIMQAVWDALHAQSGADGSDKDGTKGAV